MKDQIRIPGVFKAVTAILIAAGLITFIVGLMTDPRSTWANYLTVNYYFFSLAAGGLFFLTIQSISRSGWATAYMRIPEAMMMYIPVAAVLFLLFIPGMAYIYPWVKAETTTVSPLLEHKSAFLNVPAFIARMTIYFSLWILLVIKLRKLSVGTDSMSRSDPEGIMSRLSRTEIISRIMIFVLAITFSLSAFEWIMSIDVSWYSSIFAVKNFISAFLHGVAIMILILFILHKRGHYPFLNKYHIHDFSRYVFMISIVWGYFWFAQYMIIWYGNIPEETIYYHVRWQEGWKVLFFLEPGLNWFIPFMVLLPVQTSRNLNILIMVVIILIVGQYIELYFQVMPGTTGKLHFGWIEAGMFLGFAGLFSFMVAMALSRAGLIPVNHPFLEESLEHRF